VLAVPGSSGYAGGADRAVDRQLQDSYKFGLNPSHIAGRMSQDGLILATYDLRHDAPFLIKSGTTLTTDN
jgi:hypothetical protein